MAGRIEQKTEKVLLENYDNYYRLAYSYVKTEQDALDVVQESAYKAIRDCGKVREEKYIGTWIYRIVVNTAMDVLRKQGREILMEENLPEEAVHPSYDSLELGEILERLDGKERAVIILRYFQDLKLEEIAEVLEENVNTVKARLYRTLKKLRVELEPDGAGRRTR
ncbi:RNA polymerase subunit sigma-24 [Lachnoclostridium sp. An14]|uniref:sigma-70 family RNA polymerase sigma factor n=1 Tax=Lachnoclostridium sp. An14 TaxID=1965562 RepID=UPI000B3788F6|nr:sigma-70 family RNA polymerase sigma factor [Lachnoclostridium sp. An14]OUQ11468.1 RNA polymerase subunit sigma-24 [Lachnoclostridium sp. An14]